MKGAPDRADAVALAVAVACGFLASALVVDASHGPWTARVELLPLALALPLLPRLLGARVPRAERPMWSAAALGVALALAIPIGGGAPGATLAALSVALVPAAFLAGSRRRRGSVAAPVALVVAFQAVLALALAPGPAVLVLALTGVVSGLSVAMLSRGSAGRPRTLEVLGLSATVVVAGFFLNPLFASMALVARGLLADEPATSRAGEPHRPEPETTGRYSSEAPLGTYRDALEYGGALAPLSEDLVMEVRPLEGYALPPYLHMRGIVLDTYAGDELRAGARGIPPRFVRGPDGWTRLGVQSGGVALGLEVFQRRLTLPPRDWTVLFAPRPAAAVNERVVLHDPDSVLVVPDVSRRWRTYHVLALEPPRVEKRARARHPDPRYTALPPASADLDELARLARREASGARSDAERVERIADHLRRNFEYSLADTGFAGVRGLAEFVRREEGYCTHFAAASTLMLRTLDIPARVATGFLAHEPLEEAEGFVVRARDAHAWTEVYFEGVGWVVVDATPSARRARAFERGVIREEGLATWAIDVWDELVAWSEGEGHLLAVTETIAEAPRWLVLFVVLTVAALAALTRRARSRTRAGTSKRGAALAAHRARLVRALERKGARRRPGQTLPEFVERIGALAPLPAELPSVVSDLDRWRFGASRPEPAQLERYERLLGELERVPSA